MKASGLQRLRPCIRAWLSGALVLAELSRPAPATQCGSGPAQVLLGAEPAELGQDDLDELAEDEDEYFRLGDAGEQFRDYAALELKGDHGNRRARTTPVRSSQYPWRLLFSKVVQEPLTWERWRREARARAAPAVCGGLQRPGGRVFAARPGVTLSALCRRPARRAAARAQAAVGVPGRAHLPGDVLAGVPPGVRLPDRHRGAGVPAGVRARVRADAALAVRGRQRRPGHGDHHCRAQPPVQGAPLALCMCALIMLMLVSQRRWPLLLHARGPLRLRWLPLLARTLRAASTAPVRMMPGEGLRGCTVS
jgi:hypothetical protein